jgi:hypothetical protein
MGMLLSAADEKLPSMFAWIAIRKALTKETPPNEPRRKAAKKYKVIK